MGKVTINKEAFSELILNEAISIAKTVQEELKREDAIEQGLNAELIKRKYDTRIVVENDTVSIVPEFDNRVDEFSNSLLMTDKKFYGNMTLTKMKNKLTD